MLTVCLQTKGPIIMMMNDHNIKIDNFEIDFHAKRYPNHHH